ncbi:MAG TPA: oxalurate catabolism protein HpxZ, partial [Burkholderiales bacterium]|nr:oxalurate catabolism protein HpxZ [Burkholderiales bacterium]
MIEDINIPRVLVEVQAAFARYEEALVDNNVKVLDDMFWSSKHTIRYGVTESLYGYAAIQAFRKARSPAGLKRLLKNTVITTYGEDFATANTEFVRESNPNKIGRQSQT